MRRNIRGNKPDLPQVESFGSYASNLEVSAMDRVECAAE
jgi:hypothetical protein